jgi:CGNR zinc finger/Putative stress-induced transcription regulator
VIFAHDTEVALAAAAALVNTSPEADRPDGAGVERLPDVAALTELFETWQWTGEHTGDEAELLARLWTADEDQAVEIVNGLLREAHALPQLVKHGEWDYHLHATDPQAPLADRMAVEAAMAMVDVVRMKELDRLRVCSAEDCNNVVVDLSKNRSRRYCDSGCGNRANVAAYRARQVDPASS